MFFLDKHRLVRDKLFGIYCKKKDEASISISEVVIILVVDHRLGTEPV